MKVDKHYVYWYHLDTHTDPITQGYIGVTNWPTRRHYQHSIGSGKGSRHLYSALKKYGDRVQKSYLMITYDREEALLEELFFRPVANIGWNICAGGGDAPDCTGRIHSVATRKQISESGKRTKASKPPVTSRFKGKTGRWTDEQRAAIGQAHKGKVISEAHRKAITEKNSGADHTRAQEVILVHKDMPSLLKRYPTITEAAQKLGVGYSGLRSLYQAAQRDRESKGPSRDGWVLLYGSDQNIPEDTVKSRLQARAQISRNAAALRESRRTRKVLE